MNRIVLVIVLAMVPTAGCSKKTKEAIADTTPPPTTSTPSQSASNSGVGNTGSPKAGGVAGRPSGGGASGGVFHNTRTAVRRTEALNELRTLGQEISILQTELGRMPTKDQILAAVKTNPKLTAAINEGTYILTGTSDAGGLWAYEVDADTIPGLALIGGTAKQSTPEELQRYFPKK